jgi:hypothetical protein
MPPVGDDGDEGVPMTSHCTSRAGNCCARPSAPAMPRTSTARGERGNDKRIAVGDGDRRLGKRHSGATGGAAVVVGEEAHVVAHKEHLLLGQRRGDGHVGAAGLTDLGDLTVGDANHAVLFLVADADAVGAEVQAGAARRAARAP